MLHYLLYIIIQKGIPAMGCLDAVLEMREAGIYKRKDWGGGLKGDLGEIAWGFAIRELCLQCCPLIAVFPAGHSVTRWPPGKNRTEPWDGFHHEEGAPTLLFLMVASEHSASDESQSESPNWSGFWRENKKHTKKTSAYCRSTARQELYKLSFITRSGTLWKKFNQ